MLYYLQWTLKLLISEHTPLIYLFVYSLWQINKSCLRDIIFLQFIMLCSEHFRYSTSSVHHFLLALIMLYLFKILHVYRCSLLPDDKMYFLLSLLNIPTFHLKLYISLNINKIFFSCLFYLGFVFTGLMFKTAFTISIIQAA